MTRSPNARAKAVRKLGDPFLPHHMPITLPSELWLDILSLAVHVPGFLDTKWDYAPDFHMWEGRLVRTLMTAKSLQTRQAITLVSRNWWWMGRSFLYEYVRVDLDAPNRVAAFTARIEQNMPIVGESGVVQGTGTTPPMTDSRGTRVKKVAVDSKMLGDDNFSGLRRLLAACPNVRLLLLDIDDYDTNFIPKLSQILQSQSRHSLRHITTHKSRPYYDTHRLYSLIDLPDIPLDSLSFTVDSTATPHWNDSPLPAALTFLSALEIIITERNRDIKFPSFTLPTLRHLFVSGLETEHIAPLLPFMKLNGPQLLGLRLWTRHSSPNLPLVLEHTTAVQSFVMDDMDLEAFRPVGDPTYPSITHIGLTGIAWGRPEDVHRIAAGLEYVLSRKLFPNLRTVRIMVSHVPYSLETRWGRPIAIAAEYGVRLEGVDRQLLRC